MEAGFDLTENDLALWAVCLAALMAVVLMAASMGSALTEAPTEDRTHKDRPPLAWRLLWPAIGLLAAWPGNLLVQPSRGRWLSLLRAGGMERALTPEQFQAGRVLLACLSVGVVTLLCLPRGLPPWPLCLGAAVLGYALPKAWLTDRARIRTRRILRELPFFLDILTLSLESGLNLTSALGHAIDKGPAGPMRIELSRVMRDLRAGRSRAEALRAMADRVELPAMSSLVAALLTAEKQGASLGQVLRAQAEQRRHERFVRAEKVAMEAPVKMLFPLVLFIFPCTFLIVFFPVASRILTEGLFR